MNRATSFLWATAVALVLSAGPVYAGKKVVQFPSKVGHTNLVHADALNPVLTVGTDQVPTQRISDRAGNNVVEFKPKGEKKVAKDVPKGGFKNILKANVANILLAGAIAGSLSAVDWVMDQGSQPVIKKKLSGTQYPDSSTIGWCQGAAPNCQNGAMGHPTKAATAMLSAQIILSQMKSFQTHPSWQSATVRIVSCTDTVCGISLDRSGYQSSTYNVFRYGTCSVAWEANGGGCPSQTAQTAPVTDAELDAFVASVFDKPIDQLRPIYSEMLAINPEIGMFVPDYLTAPDGTFVQGMSSPLRKTDIARLNPDGSISRLTRKEWGDFTVTYSPTTTEYDYKVVNHAQAENEAGEVVEEETQTEEDAGEAPELSPVLDTANDPLRDWATEIKTPPSSTTAGINYPLLFTYGGTCSVAPITLPILGTYSLDPICTAINDYVKPILAVLFAAWTILHIFGVWRETTLTVRPT